MKKKMLVTITAIFSIILINGCIKEKDKEILNVNITKIRTIKNGVEESENSSDEGDPKKNSSRKISFKKFTSKKTESKKNIAKKDTIIELYNKLELKGKLQYKVFQMAMKGLEVVNPPQKKYLTIVDFTQDSDKKRLFMIDLVKGVIVYNDFVAHGMNSGEKKAKYFSNAENSHATSLGFYLTAETYYGSNGYSLRLDGLDKGLNDNARERDIVIHGASYVSMNNIAESGKIGRSWGCPAVRPEIHKDIIDKLKGGSLLFLYAKEYDKKTTVLKNKDLNNQKTLEA